MKCIAEIEFHRLSNLSAWTPVQPHKRRRPNGQVSHYDFEDGSKLSVYTSGKARWMRDRDTCPPGQTFLQITVGHHTLGRMGRGR
jgi:hypothetical protein